MSSGADQHPALTYAGYLALDELLAAQRPRTEEHDEMLFIVIHQVYELWFKQLLHEGRHAQECLEGGRASNAMDTIKRMVTVMKTVVAQIDVLETMTPRQFSAFRTRLEQASGFESAQFRELEALLGRRDESVLAHYPDGSASRARIAEAMARPSLYDSFLTYLSGEGYALPADVLARDVARPAEPSPAVQDTLLAVYRDDATAAQMCERLVDLDEGIMEWRYRHVQMVRRTIGSKPGTGGSSGVEYLVSTLMHPAFADLWAVRARL